MSYEGFMQRWCEDGHYWETNDLYHVSDSRLALGTSFVPSAKRRMRPIMQ